MMPSANHAQKTVEIRNVMSDAPVPAPEPKTEQNVTPPATPTPQNETPSRQIPATPQAPTPAPAPKGMSVAEENATLDTTEDDDLDMPEDFNTDNIQPKEEKPQNNLQGEDARLQTAWLGMLDQIFSADPMVLYPLQQHLPIIEDNHLIIRVNSSMQVDRFNHKKEQILAYMRQQYNPDLQESKAVLDVKVESQKMIFDNKDKLQHFHEENTEFADFIRILNLTIKDS